MVKKKFRSDIELLKSKLDKLISIGKDISTVHPQVHYTARKWTPIKLILLMYYMDMYSKIMFRRKDELKISELIYIDPLAGAGTNKIQETGDVIVGSPIIGIVFSSYKFDRYFFAECDAQKRDALQSRIGRLLPSDKFVIKSDCNELLNYAADHMSNLRGRSHYVMFIDCEGIEPKWENMIKVLHHPGDLIFVFQTKVIWEQIVRWKNLDAVLSFFGTKDFMNAKQEELVWVYKKQIASVKTLRGKERELVDHVPVRGDIKEGTFYYDVIFAAEKTSGGSPWFGGLLDYVKKRIAKHTGRSVEHALDVLKGRSAQIDWFLPKPETSLDDFIRE
jgi:three-Cys-motif partner protein